MQQKTSSKQGKYKNLKFFTTWVVSMSNCLLVLFASWGLLYNTLKALIACSVSSLNYA